MSGELYEDEDWLREKYVDESLPQTKIAELADCGRTTIHRRIEKFGIVRPIDDEEHLRELYWDEGMSTREIAEELGRGRSTVLRRLKKFGIGTRESCRDKSPQYTMHTDGRGYMIFRHNGNIVYEHRLLAVVDYGVDVIRDMHVHHKNEIKWDNRSDNIELMSPSEHAKHHCFGSGGVAD